MGPRWREQSLFHVIQSLINLSVIYSVAEFVADRCRVQTDRRDMSARAGYWWLYDERAWGHFLSYTGNLRINIRLAYLETWKKLG